MDEIETLLTTLKIYIETNEGVTQEFYQGLCMKARGTIEQLQTKNKRLKKGENDWWQKRWVNNDVGKQLIEIRKKWLIAYQCAENYQKMYEQLQAENKKLKDALKRIVEIKVNLSMDMRSESVQMAEVAEQTLKEAKDGAEIQKT